jgi:hypothetical protein
MTQGRLSSIKGALRKVYAPLEAERSMAQLYELIFIKCLGQHRDHLFFKPT